jgi:nucleotide-binding universal stress UspA family protein
MKVDWHVHSAAVADVTRSIVEHSTAEFQPDLIILTSHGNSGMHDLFFGNIAQQVAAVSGTPVLLIKPGSENKVFHVSCILVPLDNESIHDAVLPYVTSLAKVYQAQLNLICVIPTLGTLSGEQAAAGSLMPTTTTAYLNMTEENAEEHLKGHLDILQRESIPATADIVRGDPAPVIAKSADELQADLIVFGTHGRAGLEAFWNRSVAASVARRTRLPILLIPLADQFSDTKDG